MSKEMVEVRRQIRLEQLCQVRNAGVASFISWAARDADGNGKGEEDEGVRGVPQRPGPGPGQLLNQCYFADVT